MSQHGRGHRAAPVDRQHEKYADQKSFQTSTNAIGPVDGGEQERGDEDDPEAAAGKSFDKFRQNHPENRFLTNGDQNKPDRQVETVQETRSWFRINEGGLGE